MKMMTYPDIQRHQSTFPSSQCTQQTVPQLAPSRIVSGKDRIRNISKIGKSDYRIYLITYMPGKMFENVRNIDQMRRRAIGIPQNKRGARYGPIGGGARQWRAGRGQATFTSAESSRNGLDMLIGKHIGHLYSDISAGNVPIKRTRGGTYLRITKHLGLQSLSGLQGHRQESIQKSLRQFFEL